MMKNYKNTNATTKVDGIPVVRNSSGETLNYDSTEQKFVKLRLFVHWLLRNEDDREQRTSLTTTKLLHPRPSQASKDAQLQNPSYSQIGAFFVIVITLKRR